jgi:hypothetical protein
MEAGELNLLLEGCWQRKFLRYTVNKRQRISEELDMLSYKRGRRWWPLPGRSLIPWQKQDILPQSGPSRTTPLTSRCGLAARHLVLPGAYEINLVYFQQYKKRAKAKGKKKCHTETMRGRKSRYNLYIN